MATKYGTAYAKFIAVPQLLVKLNEWGGKLRACVLEYILAGDATDPNNGDTIYFGRIPKGARVFPGWAAWGDIGAAGATLQLGIVGDTDRYSAALDISAAGSSVTIASTAALFAGEELSADVIVIGTCAGGDWDGAAATFFRGCIPYVLD